MLTAIDYLTKKGWIISSDPRTYDNYPKTMDTAITLKTVLITMRSVVGTTVHLIYTQMQRMMCLQ